MKEVPRNKQCWVEDCKRAKRKNYFKCTEHLADPKAKIKVPGIKGFDNTPTKT